MKIALSTESCCDLPKELYDEIDCSIIPYTIILGDKEYKDGTIAIEEMYKYADEHGKLPRTSAVNPAEFDEYFAKLLEDHDAVIHISLSSKITSTTSHAIEAAERASKPVYVVDSLTLSTGLSCLLHYARELINAGYEAKEVYEKLLERRPAVQTSFVVETVKYLHMGGRCSGLAAFFAGRLGIRPTIVMKDGVMHSGEKHRGPMKKVIAEYVDTILERYKNFDPSIIFVTYSVLEQETIDMVINKCKEAGFEKVYTAKTGATIGTHCGPGTLGILFFSDGPHPVEKKH